MSACKCNDCMLSSEEILKIIENLTEPEENWKTNCGKPYIKERKENVSITN